MNCNPELQVKIPRDKLIFLVTSCNSTKRRKDIFPQVKIPTCNLEFRHVI